MPRCCAVGVTIKFMSNLWLLLVCAAAGEGTGRLISAGQFQLVLSRRIDQAGRSLDPGRNWGG
ncbi:MAG TPA: hypothetical protein DIT35_09255 [Rhodospirillaceae bacterium]|nr:hypothetical protein [Rhodospirillaceae bacterium]